MACRIKAFLIVDSIPSLATFHGAWLKMVDLTFTDKFRYTNPKNPYNDKLADFSGLILRDHEGEMHKGQWNREVFKRNTPLCLEIGSGYGHFMLEYCDRNPDINFVGMDYRFKRSFQLAKKLSQKETNNFRYLRAKGERINYLFDENELNNIFYFFPDPWYKNRHHKKRLFQESFVQSAFKVLSPGGKIYIKTDHDGLAEWMEEVINNHLHLFEVSFCSKDLWKDSPDHFLTSFTTKFEKIFLQKGIKIKAFVLESKKFLNG